MKYITYKGKQYPILELCIQDGQYFKMGLWVRIAHEKLLDELNNAKLDIADNFTDKEAIAIDEIIYYFVDDDVDFSKVQAGDIIMLDEEFTVLDVIQ